MREFYQGKLEEALGYIRHDYSNRQSSNSRNDYSFKKFKSSAGEIEIKIKDGIILSKVVFITILRTIIKLVYDWH